MITPIIKVQSTCNLNCRYCYYLGPRGMQKKERMSRSTLEHTIREVLLANKNRARFFWHGGEPLLAGIDFYQHVIELQKKYKCNGQKIINSIQTNGTLIDPEWVTFFKENNFQIGISLDGPEDIHNENRIYHSGRGSFLEIQTGIELLKKAKVNFGILAVVTKSSLRHTERIYRYFADNALWNIDFLPHTEIDPETGQWIIGSITAEEFTQFLLTVLEIWFQEDNNRLHIRSLENLITGLVGGRPNICKFARTCHRFVMVQPNGDIYADDNFGVNPDFHFGNLCEQSLEMILQTQRYRDFTKSVSDIKPECIECQWYSICGGGCSYRRYMKKNDFYDEAYFCNTWKTLLAKLSNHVNEILGYVPYFENHQIVTVPNNKIYTHSRSE